MTQCVIAVTLLAAGIATAQPIHAEPLTVGAPFVSLHDALVNHTMRIALGEPYPHALRATPLALS
jgi:hypothetical protein